MGMIVFQPRETEKARQLRKGATPAERQLWVHLNARRLNSHKFSRQMPVRRYVADFLCREFRLVVEIDGYSHDLRIEYDAHRTRWLHEQGYNIIRFTNDDVLNAVEGVVVRISEILDRLKPHPQPLPQAGGE